MRYAMTIVVSGVVAFFMTAGSAAAKVPSLRILSNPLLAAGAAEDKKLGSKKNEKKEEDNKADSKNSKQGEDKDNKKRKETEGKNKKGDDGDEEKSEKLPKPVAEAMKSIFPGAKIVGTEKEDEDGKVSYEVRLRYKSGQLEATLTPKGRVVKIKMKARDDEDDEKGKGGKNEKGKKDDNKDEGKSKKGDDDAKGKKSNKKGDSKDEGKKGTKKSERE